MRKDAKKVKGGVLLDLLWYCRTFGPSEFGAWGILWPQHVVVERGGKQSVRTSWTRVHHHELSDALQAELRDVLGFAGLVNAKVESILERHLAGKKKGRKL